MRKKTEHSPKKKAKKRQSVQRKKLRSRSKPDVEEESEISIRSKKASKRSLLSSIGGGLRRSRTISHDIDESLRETVKHHILANSGNPDEVECIVIPLSVNGELLDSTLNSIIGVMYVILFV